jgi:hypothetical protein
VWTNHRAKNAYDAGICLFYQLKQKYARTLCAQTSHALWSGNNVCSHRICLECIFSVLFVKTGNMHFSVSHVRIFRSKNSLFLDPFFAWPLCSRFYTFITWINFVIFSIRICTRVEKFLRNGHHRCPKSTSTKHFWENRRVARCFAELFGIIIWETIHAVEKIKLYEMYKNYETRIKQFMSVPNSIEIWKNWFWFLEC